jgi:hypothetical protein
MLRLRAKDVRRAALPPLAVARWGDVELPTSQALPAKVVPKGRLVLIADAVPALAVPDRFLGLLPAALRLAGLFVPEQEQRPDWSLLSHVLAYTEIEQV